MKTRSFSERLDEKSAQALLTNHFRERYNYNPATAEAIFQDTVFVRTLLNPTAREDGQIIRYFPKAAEPAGEALHLRLHWRAMRPLAADYTAFTHLINQVGHIYGQHDRRLGGDFFPTSLWPEGELVSEDYVIRVQPGTPPRRYLLEVGTYLPGTGQRLPLLAEDGSAEGDRLVLAEIQVGRANLPAAEMDMDPLPTPAVFGPMQLLGYRLPDAPLPPGAVLHPVLYWQALAPGDPSVQVHLRLLDEAGRAIHEHVAPPADRLYPPERWEPGEIVRDVHGMLVPPHTAPGRYRVAVRSGESGQFTVLPKAIEVRWP